MTSIKISNLTFAYEGSYDDVFTNLNAEIDTNWKLGLVGRNGRGKTTLCRLLMGNYEYRGSISLPVSCEYFPYQVPDSSANAWQLADALGVEYQPWQLERECRLLGMGGDVLERSLTTLSLGEQTKLLLAILFLRANSFLLIDEPTNHLDLAGRQVVGRYLKSKSGFILISHDRAFLDSCIDHIMAINKTGIDIRQGNFSTWEANKKQQDDWERAENARLQQDIKRLAHAAQRSQQWSDQVEKSKFGQRPSGNKADRGYIGHQAAKMTKRAKAIANRQQAALEEKSHLLKNIESADELKLIPAAYHSRRLAELEQVSLFYGEKEVCHQLSFTIEQGDRIALIGANGSGKSTLLKLLCGQPISHTGTCRLGSGLIISYLPQDTSFLHSSLSAFAAERQVDETLLKSMLRKLDFPRTQFDKDMASYSGGQKKKVLIAKSLCEQAHLYIWDEPLNFVDIISRMQLEKMILSYTPTMVLVEHDASFCQQVATQKIVLK